MKTVKVKIKVADKDVDTLIKVISTFQKKDSG
ncbi:hypothetical protein ES703_36410 [subsurface metagenome]